MRGEPASIRLVDTNGAVASTGRLEVRLDGSTTLGYGTVCGLTAASADVACRQMGYDFGAASPSPCGQYGASNLCGSAGSPVAMRSLSCEGHELRIADCQFKEADEACLRHESDTVLFCGQYGMQPFQDGQLRLLSAEGAPALNELGSTKGRLEVFLASTNSWAPVCKAGFGPGSATVACKQMGFSGTLDWGSCATEQECGTVPPHLSEVACSGSEKNLVECSHAVGDDVFCAAEESVVMTCSGTGDVTGPPMKVPRPVVSL